jgi:hypothetical protein
LGLSILTLRNNSVEKRRFADQAGNRDSTISYLGQIIKRKHRDFDIFGHYFRSSAAQSSLSADTIPVTVPTAIQDLFPGREYLLFTSNPDYGFFERQADSGSQRKGHPAAMTRSHLRIN